jgi:hypothetical protein
MFCNSVMVTGSSTGTGVAVGSSGTGVAVDSTATAVGSSGKVPLWAVGGTMTGTVGVTVARGTKVLTRFGVLVGVGVLSLRPGAQANIGITIKLIKSLCGKDHECFISRQFSN